MATNKPRITITLDPEIYGLLRTISNISGQSMSGIIVEFLDGARPVFESMSDTFGKIKAAKDFEKRVFLDALEESERVLSPLAIQALGIFDSSVKSGLHGACRGKEGDVSDAVGAARCESAGGTDGNEKSPIGASREQGSADGARPLY